MYPVNNEILWVERLFPHFEAIFPDPILQDNSYFLF